MRNGPRNVWPTYPAPGTARSVLQHAHAGKAEMLRGPRRDLSPISRQRFPVIDKGHIYMDHGASTHPPLLVLGTYRDFLKQHCANALRSPMGVALGYTVICRGLDLPASRRPRRAYRRVGRHRPAQGHRVVGRGNDRLVLTDSGGAPLLPRPRPWEATTWADGANADKDAVAGSSVARRQS